MKPIEFEISNGELFCLAAILGYRSLLNIEYDPEETGADLVVLFNRLTEKLRDKKLIDEDFDGNITISKEMQKAISLCAEADRFWVVQSHVRSETIADYIYTVYNSGDDHLVLEQVDGENYKGMLTNDHKAMIDNISTNTPFSESTHQHTEIHAEAVGVATADEKYSLITVSLYTVDNENDGKSLICHSADMFLFIDSGGSYKLSVTEDETADETVEESGLFLPISKQDYSDNMESIFTVKEDV